jgi:hypothetical protein
MHLNIQLLRDQDGICAALRRDGWEFEAGRHDVFVATHPAVPDNAVARNRLHHLGLLTSSFLRIDLWYGGGPE